LLYRIPVYGDLSHPHFPVVLAEAAVLLEQAVIDAHKSFPDDELETFFSAIALEPAVYAQIEQIFEMERQQELEAEALAS
jgi:hypothetical protein